MTTEMKLVPVEPTEEMIRVGWVSMGFSPRRNEPPAYRAMLAAAPVIRRAVLEEAAREAWRASQWARNTPDDIAAAIRALGAKP